MPRRARPGRSSRAPTAAPSPVVAEHTPASALTVSHAGHVYAVDEISHSLYFVPKGGTRKLIDETLTQPGGVALSPDQTELYVSDAGRELSYAYRIQADGTPVDKQPYIYVQHQPGAAHEIGSAGMTVDTEGPHLHGDHARHPGLRSARQVPRHPADARRGPRSRTVTFSGPAFSHLVVVRGGVAYARRIKADRPPVVDAPGHGAGAEPLAPGSVSIPNSQLQLPKNLAVRSAGSFGNWRLGSWGVGGGLNRWK
jgi:hypothetical protein